MNQLDIIAASPFSVENPSFVGMHYDASRHFILRPQLFFKKLRPIESGFAYHDLICEVVCGNLGQLLDLPVLRPIPYIHPSFGLGLLSPFVGSRSISTVLRESLVNVVQLPGLFAFEQWVMNVDDKPDHLPTIQMPDGRNKVTASDHGHTLHSWQPEFQNIDTLAQNPKLIQLSSEHNGYGIRNFEEVREWIQKIQSLNPFIVRERVVDAFSEVAHLECEQRGFSEFLGSAANHQRIIFAILAARQNSIEQIIISKCAKLGILVPIKAIPEGIASEGLR